MTGWGRGRCIARPVATAPQQDTADMAGRVTPQESSDQSAQRQVPVVYGSGRSGIPRGCGRGFCGGTRGGGYRSRGEGNRGRC